MKIQIEVFWVMAPYSVVVGRFGGHDPWRYGQQNVGTLPHHYTAS